MSAESKKKRGESGSKNAKSIPFRYHGYPHGYSLSLAHGGSSQFAGAKLLHAMALGAMLGGPGYAPSGRMYRAADVAIERIEARGRKPHEGEVT